MASSTGQRIYYIDFLKFIGLSLIILAHVKAPDSILYVRSFDVPLMVFISSLLAANSYKGYLGKPGAYFQYCYHRIKRLVFPTWAFLVFYFIFEAVTTKQHSLKYYINSFLLTRYGIGYVWIILIYLYCALLTPLFVKMGKGRLISVILICVYLLYELAYYYGLGTNNRIVLSTVYYIIPYGLIAYLGHIFPTTEKKTRLSLLIISMFIFFSFIAYYFISADSIPSINDVKYPPRAYFLSYGLMAIFILMLICERFKDSGLFRIPAIVYISKNSLQIYLGHILILYIYKHLPLPGRWYFKYVTVYIATLIMVTIFNVIKKRVLTQAPTSQPQ